MELFIQTTIVYNPMSCQLFKESSQMWNYCDISTTGGYKLSDGYIFMLNLFLKFYINGSTIFVYLWSNFYS